jgi:hypothetical protein
MVNELKSDSDTLRKNQLGYEQTPQAKASPLTHAFREHVLSTLNKQKAEVAERKEKSLKSITRLRQEVERLRQSVIAFAETQKENGLKQGSESTLALVREWELLTEAYHQRILAARYLPSARDVIEDFIDKLTPEYLKTHYPEYYD